MRTHPSTNDTKTAIGYVRVSKQEQATDGVSLDAQRDRLRADCKAHAIKLIEIKVGFLRKEGGIWHPAPVHALLASMDSGLPAA